MSESDSLEASAMSALPPWRETALARLPRKTKLIATFLFLVLMIAPPLWVHLRAQQGGDKAAGGTEQMQGNGHDSRGDAIVQTDAQAEALNDQDDRSVKLMPAPDLRITEDTPEGGLPRISEDGLRPWQLYARPFNTADKRPRIALIITGLGQSREITDAAITQLPPTVTLALASQSPALGAWGERARQDGHEIILQIPMEPFDYPRSDPGPETLLTSLPNSDNITRLLKIMSRASGYVGIISVHGSRFTTDATKFAPVLEVLQKRGLMVVDARAAPHSAVSDMAHNAGVPVVAVTQRIDGDLSPEAITGALNDLEKTARLNGRAVGILELSPVVVAQLQGWLKTLPQRGIALAPVSAMVQ